jgi:putative 4-mercaptohistidine N1-methyltranferase
MMSDESRKGPAICKSPFPKSPSSGKSAIHNPKSAIPLVNPYETPRLVQEYLLFHYGRQEDLLPWETGPVSAWGFPIRAVTENLEPGATGDRALDLGCAVGRSSFELARTHREVIGIDFSHAFIAAARHLAEKGPLPYTYTEEGTLTREALAEPPVGVDKSRLRFEQGDATELRPDLGAFDTVLAANLLCRLPEPRRALARFPELVKPGGRLIITSPYTWLEEYTPRGHWLGGYDGEAGPVRSLDGLKAALEPRFTLTATRELPFLIREHARKYQWSVAQATVWTRSGSG